MRPEPPPLPYDNSSPDSEDYPSPASNSGLWFLALLGIVILALGALCWLVPEQWLEAQPMDRAALDMPFEQPRVDSSMGFSGVPSPSERVLQTLRQRRALFAGDFEFLERSLSAERQQALSSEEGSIGYAPLVHSLEETALAGIDRCQEWLQTIPDSYLAHWICAEIWNDGAWEARSGGYMSEINIAQSVLMTERLLESNRLLERAIVLDERPVEALTLLAHNHSLLGTRLAEDESLWSRVASLLTSDDQDTLDDLPHPRITSLAARYHAQAVELYPRYLPAHRNWVNFLQPKWGGSQGLVQEAIEQAQHAGIAQGDLHDMRDEFIVSPTSFASPGATRAYWENAIDQQPTFRRLEGLMHDLAGLENWKAMIPVAERIIASYPDESGAYFWLAEAKKMTGKIDEAQAAHLYAAAMGHDGAIQEVIMAFIRGGLGVDDGYAGPGLPELCQYSAALGSPIGANCLGAGYFEGGQPGVPFARDPAQGYAWHLLGSRAGHYNSQFDLGWMLYTGRVPGVDREMAQELGIFWLRRAEEKGHMFASRRLDEMGIDRSKAPSSEDNLLMLSNSLKTALASLRQQLRNLLV